MEENKKNLKQLGGCKSSKRRNPEGNPYQAIIMCIRMLREFKAVEKFIKSL